MYTFDPFADQEMMMFEDLEKKLFEADYFGGISEHAREVLYEFMMITSREMAQGIILVQAWMDAIGNCISNEFPDEEFPVTNGGSPLFPLVLGLMDLEPDVEYSALAIYGKVRS